MNGEREKEIRDNAVGSRHSRGSWSEDAICDLLAALDAERERAEQAIAHDRQPYPTAYAYEAACKARDRWQVRASSWEEAAEQVRRVLPYGGCSVCRGAERGPDGVPCSNCHGTGEEPNLAALVESNLRYVERQWEEAAGELADALEPESLAQRFHEAYERLAPAYGYETRKESAVPWDEVPEPNRSLMYAVADAITRDVLIAFRAKKDNG